MKSIGYSVKILTTSSPDILFLNIMELDSTLSLKKPKENSPEISLKNRITESLIHFSRLCFKMNHHSFFIRQI